MTKAAYLSLGMQKKKGGGISFFRQNDDFAAVSETYADETISN